MMKIRILSWFLLLAPFSAMAQDLSVKLVSPALAAEEKPGNLFSMASASARQKPLLLRPLYWVKTLIDSSAVATVDRRYIEQPRQQWAVELRTDLSKSKLDMEADWVENGVKSTWGVMTENSPTLSAGAWVGYRGYGFGLSKELRGGYGTSLSFGAMGGSFGINLRIRSYRSSSPELSINGEGFENMTSMTYDLDDPIRVRSLFLDGYYMFNGRHFSYAAAYDQSLIQRISAGSLVAGLMYYHSSIYMDSESNILLQAWLNGLSKLKFSQGSVGVGYAYNWVPARGWLVSVMAMPMLTFYNKMYATILDWNPDANDEIYVTETERDRTGKLGLNYDARLCVTYNWNRFYLRTYGYHNRFRYANDDNTGIMRDWAVYAALGYRF